MRKLSFALLLLLAACPKHNAEPVDAGGLPPGAPKPLTEAEPNDEMGRPQHLNEAVNVAAELRAPAGKKADEDWYALDFGATAGRLTLTVDPAPPLDVAIEVFDGDQVRRYAQDGAAGGGAEVIHGLAPGRARLVRIFSKKGEGTGAYHLTVTAEPDDGTSELEPNNRAVDASPLATDKPVKGYLADAADEDWFKLTLPGPAGEGGSSGGSTGAAASGEPAPAPAGQAPAPQGVNPEAAAPGVAAVEDAGAADAGAVAAVAPAAPPPTLLHLTVSGVPGVRLDVSVVNAAQATVFNAKGKSPGDPVEVRNLALRGPERDFFVVVKSAYIGVGKEAKRSASVDQPYTVTAAMENAQGAVELEPNDDPAHATPVAISGNVGTLEGFLTPKSDVDYYVVHSDQPASARVELSGVEHLDLELAVMSAPDGGKEQALLVANDGEMKEPEVLTNLAFGPGDLLLRVQSAARKGPDGKWTRDTENGKDPYRLTVALSPDDASREREPNNTPEVATPIQLGQTLRGTIHPKRDVDFYKLDLSQQPVKVNLKATCTGILKVDIALYLYRLKPDGTLGLVQTSDTAKGDQPETITYALDPGVYFLKVKDLRDREANFVDSYALHVEAQ